MLTVLSPAKALDFESPIASSLYSEPDHLDESARLIERLRTLSLQEVAGLMSLSDKLAALNVARYAAWSRPFTPANARPAVLAFNGDVYDGLAARELSDADLSWAQDHLRILSGLYGVLRPLDLIQPYRLEMGTRLANPRGRNLYAWWGDRISDALNAVLAAQGAQSHRDHPAIVVNLASEEYFKSVRREVLNARVVAPAFEDWKGGRYRIISFHAKRARGLMARYIIVHRIDDPAALNGFDEGGYRFAPEASTPDRPVFRRRQDD